jgi:exo-beta-1,3-glucanase (GH17 family)
VDQRHAVRVARAHISAQLLRKEHILLVAWQTRLGLGALAAVILILAACAPLPATTHSPADDCLAANGVAYGPFRDGQGPDYKPPVIPRLDQIEEDLHFLRDITKHIRTYSTTDTQANIPHLAQRAGIKVAQGIELGPNAAANEKQIAVAVQMAREGLVEALIVGNEILSAGVLPKEKLLDYLQRVRKLTPPAVPVTTAEVWDVWNNNPDLAASTDIVMAHFYPFWEKQHIDDANQSLWRNYDKLQSTLRRVYPKREVRVIIGETGWPSGGTPQGRAVPGPQNQRRFIEEFMSSACARSVPFYFFEAFDEEWKWQEGESSSAGAQRLPPDRSFAGKWVGSSWGIYQSNGRLKPELSDLFKQPSPTSRQQREIFVNGHLAAHYAIGADSSGRQRTWFKNGNGVIEMAYPAGQRWGVTFITVGEPSSPPRPWKDFSGYDAVSFEIRGARGRESVRVGIKDPADPNDGNEAQVALSEVATEFQTYTIPLSQFASPQLPIPDGLSQLNVVLQFFFSGSQAQTVYVRNIRYLASK